MAEENNGDINQFLIREEINLLVWERDAIALHRTFYEDESNSRPTTDELDRRIQRLQDAMENIPRNRAGFFYIHRRMQEAIEQREYILEQRRVQAVVKRLARVPRSTPVCNKEAALCAVCLDPLVPPEDDGTSGWLFDRTLCCGLRCCRKCTPFQQPFPCGRKCQICDEWAHYSNRHANDRYLHYANEGKAWAQYQLGIRYKLGSKGLTRDTKEAIRWCTLAAEQGDIKAQKALVAIYSEGEEQDLGAKVYWARRAAEGGDVDLLVWLYKTLPLENPAKLWYLTLAATHDRPEAQYHLGRTILDGLIPSEHKIARALLWFQKAAKRGNKEAQYRMAYHMLEQMKGIMRDPNPVGYGILPVANYWFRRALSENDSPIEEHEEAVALKYLRGIERSSLAGFCDCCGDTERGAPIWCPICGVQSYCSRECQSRNWRNGHDIECMQCVVYEPDDTIRLVNLRHSTHLNGSTGSIQYFDHKQGRYRVEIMTKDAKRKILLVHVDNLVLV